MAVDVVHNGLDAQERPALHDYDVLVLDRDLDGNWLCPSGVTALGRLPAGPGHGDKLSTRAPPGETDYGRLYWTTVRPRWSPTPSNTIMYVVPAAAGNVTRACRPLGLLSFSVTRFSAATLSPVYTASWVS